MATKSEAGLEDFCFFEFLVVFYGGLSSVFFCLCFRFWEFLVMFHDGFVVVFHEVFQMIFRLSFLQKALLVP